MSQRYRRPGGEPGGHNRRDRTQRWKNPHPLQAAEERIWLGWWERGHFIALACLLREIGRDEAVVVVPELPPAKQPVWLRLERGGNSIGSVQGTFASATPVGPGRIAARLRFSEVCPDSLIHAAVLGLSAHRVTLN